MMLERLQQIKQRQRDKSEQALLQAGARLRALETELKGHIETLEEYIVWRKEQEKTLYQQAHDAFLTRSGVDKFRLKIAKLRSHDATLKKNIATCEQQIEAAKNTVQVCQARLQTANKAMEKFASLIALEEKKRALLANRNEENQLDEFVTSRFSGMKSI